MAETGNNELVNLLRDGANVLLDLLAGESTERTELTMVQRKPLPFPPEPLAYLGIQFTRWSLDRADRTTASETPGYVPWIGSASASTPDSTGQHG